MAPGQPSISEKIALFRLMDAITGDADDSEHGDGLDAQEQLDRQHRVRFFRTEEPGADTKPGEDKKADAASVSMAREQSSRHRLRCFRNADAQTTPPIVKATQHMYPRTRGRELLNLAGDETVIQETTRVSKVQQQRRYRNPLTLQKQLDIFTGRAVESPSMDVNKGKKRKRHLPKLRPESEQIFRGFRFYYVPDNDIAPARRLRINKAREYGASWTRDPLAATHVIVDKGIGYSDVKRILGQAVTEKIAVNEDYAIDCVRFRSVLDHRQRKYHIKDQPLDRGGGDGGNVAMDGQQERPDESMGSLTKVKPQHRNSRKREYCITTVLGTPLSSNETSSDGNAAQKSNEDAPTADLQPASLNVGQDATTDTGNNNAPRNGGCEKNDELSQYITLMQEFKNLPLDNDEDEDFRSAIDHEPEQISDDDVDEEEGCESQFEQRANSQHARSYSRSRNKVTRFEDRFACNQAGLQDASADNPNARTIEVLQRMANYYDRISDHWRTTGYRKAITTLKRQRAKICTEEEAFRLPHIGQRIAQKIEEIVTTDQLQRLRYAEDEPTDAALQLFLRIYGVGNKQAQQWISKGYRTLHDVRTMAKLNPSQQIGIDHYEDLNTKIPRLEVEALGSFVKKVAAQIDPLVELIIGGSYRRGSAASHDIDLIVTKPDTSATAQLRPFLARLMHVLTEKGFLTAQLQHASFHSRSNASKFHGCCVLPPSKGPEGEDLRPPPVWRRIDLLLVPATETGAALIYFTGNDIFNRSMRLLASKKGMRLNQRGLYEDRLVGGGKLVEGRCERRIFEVLGVKWREPRERWC